MNFSNIPKTYQSVIEKLITIAKSNNFVIYAVGGFVRDIILNREPNDLDIMVEGEEAGIEFSKVVAEKLNIHPPIVFEKFGTAKLLIEDKEIEFIMPRKEYYDENSRNPETEIGTLEQDALRRDFTVNALFLCLNNFTLLDLTRKGIKDIENKIIRVTDESASDIIFEQDPLRILRAVRQSFQLKFKIEPKTYQSMKNKSGRISIVSGERISEEINKILLLDKPSEAFSMLDDIGLLDILFPELKQAQGVSQPKQYHTKDVYGHTMDVVDNITPDLLLRVSALFHDVGKPETKTETDGKISFINHETTSSITAKQILLRLKYPSDFIKKVCFLIQNHMYPKMYTSQWKDSSVRKFAYKIGDDIENIKLLNYADTNNFNGELFDRVEQLRNKDMLMPKEDLLDGNELMKKFNRPAGKWISQAKEYIRNLQSDNPKITKEEALKKLKNILKIQQI